jgi:hypothetical protein
LGVGEAHASKDHPAVRLERIQGRTYELLRNSSRRSAYRERQTAFGDLPLQHEADCKERRP